MGEAPQQLDEAGRPSADAVAADLRAALIALAAGDQSARLSSDGADVELATAFDRVASMLAGAREPENAPLAIGKYTDPPSINDRTGDASFMAVLEIATWTDGLAEIDLRNRTAVLTALSDQIGQVMPEAMLGRVGAATLEFRFSADDADQAAERLAELAARIETPLEQPLDCPPFKVTIGFAEWVSTNASLFRAIENAQSALAKARASNAKVATFTEQDRAAADDRRALIHDLSHALANGELSMVYQPKLSLRSKAVEAAEALIRWRHPKRGSVPPADFIWLAEQSGAIERITRFTLEQAMADQAELIARGHNLGVNVNISGQLISDEAFVDWAIATAASAAGQIGFEITETAVISDPERALNHMRRIAEAGIPISIDDYGAGLSSLVYLKQFPAKELKIDRTFISELTRSHRDPLIVRSTIDLAHALEMEVTAEGVEHGMSLALLQVMGCDHIQGYHFAKPMTVDDLADFLTAQAEKPEVAIDLKSLLKVKKARF